MPNNRYDYDRGRDRYDHRLYPERQLQDLTRRNFLRLFGAVAGGVAIGGATACVGEKLEWWSKIGGLIKSLREEKLPVAGEATASATASPTSTHISDPAISPSETAVLPTNEPELSPTPEERLISHTAGGWAVYFNQEELPVYYVRLKDKKRTDFTKEEIENFDRLRELARKNQEPEVAWMIPSDQGMFGDTTRLPSEAHPEKGPPSDLLTEEELKERGVNIIQTEEVKLHLRQSAFAEGQPLAIYTPGGPNSLEIILVDGPVVTSSFLGDSKYDSVRGILEERDASLEEYKKGKISEIEANIESFRSELQEAIKGEQGKIKFYQDILRLYKGKLYLYQHFYTDEQLLLDMNTEDINFAGLYWPAEFTKRYRGEPNTAIVFVAVGKGSPPLDMVELCATPEGDYSLNQIGSFGSSSGGNEPKKGESHPSPEDFTRNSNASPDKPMSYPFGGQQAGQVLRHELQHDNLMYEVWKRILGESDSSDSIDAGEYATDMAAMKGIAEAWEQWKNSEFTDDSLYWAVWEKSDGSWIYSKKQSTKFAA